MIIPLPKSCAHEPPRPRIGLALGGGGMRGLPHIGVIKVLEREEIPIDLIAGTSMGALIGGAYACGADIARIEAAAAEMSKISHLIRLIDLKPGGWNSMISGKRIHAFLDERLGRQIHFEDLDMPFAATAVDLNSGKEVILNEGSVVDAMRASMSVPSVFAPVEVNGCRLIDGGTLNNLPVDLAYKLGADKVIAVDVMPSFAENVACQPPKVEPFELLRYPLPIADMVWHSFLIVFSSLTEHKLRECPPDLLIRPDVPKTVSLFTGFERLSELVALGEAATEAALPEIRQLLE